MSSGPASDTLYRRLGNDLRPLRRELRALPPDPRRARPVLVKAAYCASLLLLYGIRRSVRRGRARELHFHPQIPDAQYTMWSVCNLLGLRRSPVRPGARVVYVFDDNDLVPHRPLDRAPIAAAAPERTINLDCTDISKTAVSRAFEEVFGYGIEVDPAEHRGPMVEKSDANARHDARVIEGPLASPKAGCVYQMVIDNGGPDGMVEDIRLPVVGSRVPFAYLKRRPLETRFANENRSVRLADALDVVSQPEIERVVAVCRRLGLDCGEVDVVRDRRTSRLYVLDVNKTCWGPPNHLRLRDCYRAMWRLAKSFETAFIGPYG